MRIISGKARGRRLATLAGEATRPTSGRVKEALFNILAAWVPDSSWLDLYAGSGAIGLEAASRGAKRVVLVERAAPALAVIRENLAATRLEGVELLPMASDVAVKRLAGQVFDVVFMDPPYADDVTALLEAIASRGLLAPGGRLVLEHQADRAVPPRVGPLAHQRTARYTDSALSFFALAEAPGS